MKHKRFYYLLTIIIFIIGSSVHAQVNQEGLMGNWEFKSAELKEYTSDATRSFIQKKEVFSVEDMKFSSEWSNVPVEIKIDDPLYASNEGLIGDYGFYSKMESGEVAAAYTFENSILKLYERDGENWLSWDTYVCNVSGNQLTLKFSFYVNNAKKETIRCELTCLYLKH